MSKEKVCLMLILLAITIIKPSDDRGFMADWQNIINDIKNEIKTKEATK